MYKVGKWGLEPVLSCSQVLSGFSIIVGNMCCFLGYLLIPLFLLLVSNLQFVGSLGCSGASITTDRTCHTGSGTDAGGCCSSPLRCIWRVRLIMTPRICLKSLERSIKIRYFKCFDHINWKLRQNLKGSLGEQGPLCQARYRDSRLGVLFMVLRLLIIAQQDWQSEFSGLRKGTVAYRHSSLNKTR